jgi:ComF family protein
LSLWATDSFRFAVDSVAALLLPSDCRICGHPLVHLSKLPVCDPCVGSLAPSQVKSCEICGEALDLAPGVNVNICGVCRRVLPKFDFAIAYGAYDGTLRSLVHLLKYEQVRSAANLLGGRLAEAICGRITPAIEPILIAPVPLHKSKRRQRGFNQSELIARAALRHVDPLQFELHTGNLRRVRATVSQTGLTRHQRRENVRGAFTVAYPERVRDRTVVLVDDVYTTGTTLNECARVLRAAGAKQVVVATVARVYRSAPQCRSELLPGQKERAAVVAEAVAG